MINNDSLVIFILQVFFFSSLVLLVCVQLTKAEHCKYIFVVISIVIFVSGERG